MSVRRVLFASLLMMSSSLGPVSAETIQGALAKAYKFHSELNSARAEVRATDENVPLAKSGYRPTIQAQGQASYTSRNTTTIRGTPSDTDRITAGTFGVQINQMLFDGFQTRNNVRGAESQVRASNENLRNTVQNTLFNAATAYMDVIRDRRIATLTEQNLAALNEQVRAARSRFDVGEGTRTDVAQAEAARADAVATLSQARAQVMASAATYRQYVGEEPGKLASAKALSKMLPKSIDSAQALAFEEHPAILASEYLIDAAGFTVKSSEGRLLPQLEASAGVTAGRTHNHEAPSSGFPPISSGNPDGIGTSEDASATIGATLTIPLYQGGRVAATVRQNKELLGKARIDLDVNRDQVRQALSTAWSSYRAASEGVEANRTLVSARQLALNGVMEERNVGQRTTLDVLNAQSDVVEAQIALARDEHDVVVASYGILLGMGRLSVKRLGLDVAEYKPEEHYEAVKDKWFGLRTPDGR